MPEEEVILTEQDAIKQIYEISDSAKVNNDLLLKINTDLANINDNISSINDYYVIQKIEKEKENEHDTKKNNTEEQQEIKEDTTPDAEASEEITLETVSAQLDKTNEYLANMQNLQIVGIFSNGLLIGVVLFSIFWKRFFS